MDINKYDKKIKEAEELINSPFPKIIELQTMTFCNGNCIVCPYKSLKIEQNRMSDETLNRLLDEIIEHKDIVDKFIPYLNNEPSFDNRMMDILKKMHKNNIFIEVSTNISKWKYEQLDEIVKDDLIQDLRVSFFGHNKELYESMMTGLSFENNSKKLKYLLDLNKKYNNKIDIQIIVILLPILNVDEIKKGLDELFDNPKIHFFGFLDRCGKVKIAKNDLAKTENNSLIGCSLNRPYERCCIYSNGDVVLCSQDWCHDVVIGNINNSTIEEVWNSQRAKNIRKIVLGKRKCPKNFLCNKCKLAILKTENEKMLNFNGDKYMTQDDKKLIE